MTIDCDPDRLAEDLDKGVALVRARSRLRPAAAIILGSGMAAVADRIEDPVSIAYSEIPGFHSVSASGHRGQLILGQIEQTPVVAMAGRFHRYEGWTNEQVALPVRLMAAIGATRLIVSSAAGGLNPKLQIGDIVVIRDHINLMAGTLGCCRHHPLPSPRRHADVYDPALAKVAMEVALERSFAAMEGTYLATLGPTYETRSEYRMMRRIGADVVGMSTVPEVLTAADVKMRTLGLSLVSNVANPDRPVRADHAEVLEAGRAAEVKLEAIVRGAIRSR